jgi:hypothetical protein
LVAILGGLFLRGGTLPRPALDSPRYLEKLAGTSQRLQQ